MVSATLISLKTLHLVFIVLVTFPLMVAKFLHSNCSISRGENEGRVTIDQLSKVKKNFIKTTCKNEHGK